MIASGKGRALFCVLCDGCGAQSEGQDNERDARARAASAGWHTLFHRGNGPDVITRDLCPACCRRAMWLEKGGRP